MNAKIIPFPDDPWDEINVKFTGQSAGFLNAAAAARHCPYVQVMHDALSLYRLVEEMAADEVLVVAGPKSWQTVEIPWRKTS